MNRHAIQLISRGAINKIGNMLYDYGNSVWLASMGTIGQTVLGIYQISELVTSILVNPFYADCKRLYDSAAKCTSFFFPDHWKWGYCPSLFIPRLCAKSF